MQSVLLRCLSFAAVLALASLCQTMPSLLQDKTSAISQSDSAGGQAEGSTTPLQAPPAQKPASSNNDESLFVFKKQVEEVVLHATVVDEKQRLITHLDRSAFTVFEGGQQQAITSFHSEDVPVAIGVVIDNSSSMREKREVVNEAVLNLIRASNPNDEVFVVNFSQEPYLDQDFTSDIALLERALSRTSTRGSTALYDAIVASAAHLRTNARREKRVLLVITDGQDNMSQETAQDAMRHLQEKNGPILYVIGLARGEFSNPAREVLQNLSYSTGGHAFFPQSLDEVADITRTLAHDIRRQYTLAFRPHDHKADASYHPISVEARAAGYRKLTVRTRGGYYAGDSSR